jgi:AcrR family transcriptional regulator
MVSTGLRERKKWETHRALSLAAQELVHARGLERVTVEDIAAAAGVSERTFFNYFSGKDEALVGVEPTALATLADDLRRRPTTEGPAAALRAVLLAEVDPDGLLRRWKLRNELVRTYPQLLPRYLLSMVQVEEALTAALAERLGVDPSVDPQPRVLVAAALAVVRASLAWWWDVSDHRTPLLEVLEQSYSQFIADQPRIP